MTDYSSPASSSGQWREVAAAVDYLAEIERPGFTVWDAVDEAVRWWIFDHLSVDGELGQALLDLPWEDPDPLHTTLLELFNTVPATGAVDGHALAFVLDSALSAWLDRTAIRINDGQRFSSLQLTLWPSITIDVDG